MKYIIVFVSLSFNIFSQIRDTVFNSNTSTIIINYLVKGDTIKGEFEIFNKSNKLLIISKNNDQPYEYIFYKYNYDGSMTLLVGQDTWDFFNDMSYINCTAIKDKKSFNIHFLINKMDIKDKKSIKSLSELKMVFSFANKNELKKNKTKKNEQVSYKIPKNNYEKNAIRFNLKVPNIWKE